MRGKNGYVLRQRVTDLGEKLPPQKLDELIAEANGEIRAIYAARAKK